MEDMSITYNKVKFDGVFKNESIYRQLASPEVDEAWEALGVDCPLHSPSLTSFMSLTTNDYCMKDRPLVLPEELGAKAGLTKSHGQRNKKYGGGYLVNVEGLHHLHCLVCEHPVHLDPLLTWRCEELAPEIIILQL